MTARGVGRARRRSAALRAALVALAIALLLPACEAFASQALATFASAPGAFAAAHAPHHDGARPAGDCARLADAAVAPSGAQASAPERGAAFFVARVAEPAGAAAILVPQPAVVSHAPPSQIPFHSRSARVLR